MPPRANELEHQIAHLNSCYSSELLGYLVTDSILGRVPTGRTRTNGMSAVAKRRSFLPSLRCWRSVSCQIPQVCLQSRAAMRHTTRMTTSGKRGDQARRHFAADAPALPLTPPSAGACPHQVRAFHSPSHCWNNAAASLASSAAIQSTLSRCCGPASSNHRLPSPWQHHSSDFNCASLFSRRSDALGPSVAVGASGDTGVGRRAIVRLAIWGALSKVLHVMWLDGLGVTAPRPSPFVPRIRIGARCIDGPPRSEAVHPSGVMCVLPSLPTGWGVE